ncbi:MAG: 50S ribosomal protein L25 [Myxococcota bacterium]
MSNPINELIGSIRDSHGKGPARRLRQAGQIPGVVYGKGVQTLGVAIDPKVTSKMLLSPLKRNILIHLNLEGQSQKTVMVRDLQIDPVRRNLTHIDFIEIDPKVPVKAMVPLNVFGKSQAVVAGGQLEQVHHLIPVNVLPAEIPVKLDLDITELDFGSTLASFLKLPQGVELAIDGSEPIVTIKMPRADKDAAATPAAGAAPAGAPAAA